jgi:hypothetical protein
MITVTGIITIIITSTTVALIPIAIATSITPMATVVTATIIRRMIVAMLKPPIIIIRRMMAALAGSPATLSNSKHS